MSRFEFEFTPSCSPYNIVNGEQVPKVLEPYYSNEKGVIFATCPHCKYDVQRVWNLKYCGSCGGAISWNDMYVENWGAVR